MFTRLKVLLSFWKIINRVNVTFSNSIIYIIFSRFMLLYWHEIKPNLYLLTSSHNMITFIPGYLTYSFCCHVHCKHKTTTALLWSWKWHYSNMIGSRFCNRNHCLNECNREKVCLNGLRTQLKVTSLVSFKNILSFFVFFYFPVTMLQIMIMLNAICTNTLPYSLLCTEIVGFCSVAFCYILYFLLTVFH